MEVRLELLLGRRVRDAGGRDIGRIEEVRVERRDSDWLVSDYVLGVGGLLERLAAGTIARAVLGPLARRAQRRTVPWADLDISDPEHPRLRRR
jgi:hypothetical protein